MCRNVVTNGIEVAMQQVVQSTNEINADKKGHACKKSRLPGMSPLLLLLLKLPKVPEDDPQKR